MNERKNERKKKNKGLNQVCGLILRHHQYIGRMKCQSRDTLNET